MCSALQLSLLSPREPFHANIITQHTQCTMYSFFNGTHHGASSSFRRPRWSSILTSNLFGIDQRHSYQRIARTEFLVAEKLADHIQSDFRDIHRDHMARIQHQQRLQILVCFDVTCRLSIYQPHTWLCFDPFVSSCPLQLLQHSFGTHVIAYDVILTRVQQHAHTTI